MKSFFVLLSFIFQLVSIGNAQTYTAGETYFGQHEYIEYQAGNLPIIISAPHGGDLEPTDIPDRNCVGCVYVKDANTEELIRQINDAIFDLFGCHPHIIINRLHRQKLDANRSIGEAADGNSIAMQSWEEFQGFIETASDTVMSVFSKGLFIDLHGHGHDIQRLELGYRVSKSELQLSDQILNQDIYIDDSSIKNLTEINLNGLSFSDLLRGSTSFGKLFQDQSYPAVPSQSDPFPFDDDSYFSGGYNTDRHGSRSSGMIDAIQIECNRQGVRDTHANRANFAEATARVLKSYLETHYFGPEYLSTSCGLLTANRNHHTISPLAILAYPNPIGSQLHIDIPTGITSPTTIQIIDQWGMPLYTRHMTQPESIDLPTSTLAKGIYIVKVTSKEFIGINRIVK